MNTTSLIGHVVEVHAAVLRSTHPADAVVREFFRNRHYLGSRDRRFIADTLFGMVRHHRLLDARLRAAGPPAIPHTSLTLYAAFALSIECQERAVVETALRPLWETFLRDTDITTALPAIASATPLGVPGLHPAGRLALEHSMPDFIVVEWIERFGEQETADLCKALNQSAPTTARVNTLRTTVQACIQLLSQESVECTPTRLSAFGIVFNRRVNIQSLQSFRHGLFEMQDEGSQLISLLLEPRAGQAVVDACAGGGGKTLHVAALMQNTGRLAVIDVSAKRLGDIRDRLGRSGTTIVTLHEAGKKVEEEWRGGADAVLVDAPCTGTGTFRRNPGAKMRVTAEQRDRLAATQKSLLSRYSALVRPGGRLVYSTCSLLRAENEVVVKEFLASNTDFTLLPAGPILAKAGVHYEGEYLALYPHKHGTDGFFAAVMQRQDARVE